MAKILAAAALFVSSFILTAEVVSTIPAELLVQAKNKLSQNAANRLVQLEREKAKFIN